MSRRGSKSLSNDDETASEAPSSAPPTPREQDGGGRPPMPDLMDQPAGPAAVEQSPAEASDPFAPGGSEADWGEPDFFADPFKDAFGFPPDAGGEGAGEASPGSFFGGAFPSPSAAADDDPPSPYVPMHPEGWGGTGAASGVLPVDFATPRSSGDAMRRSVGNLEALSSLDGPGEVPGRSHDDGGSLGSMSQLTNPTYATGGANRDGGVDPEGEGADPAAAGSSSKENRRDGGQSPYRNIAAKYKMRKMGKLPPSYGDPQGAAYPAERKREPAGTGQEDPPLALGSIDTHDTGSDDGDQVRDESEQGRDASRSPVGGKLAGSRILSRYSQRRPGAAPGGSVSGASVGSAGQRSAGGGGAAARRLARAAAASSGSAPAGGGPPSSSLRQPYRYSRGREASASTSPVRRRRGGGAASPVKKSSPRASQSGTIGPYYSGGRRESPSVVDNPNYYNVSLTRFSPSPLPCSSFSVPGIRCLVTFRS